MYEWLGDNRYAYFIPWFRSWVRCAADRGGTAVGEPAAVKAATAARRTRFAASGEDAVAMAGRVVRWEDAVRRELSVAARTAVLPVRNSRA